MDEAIKEFKNIHDAWELDICQKHPHDPLIGGIYSRAKSHVLRLAVPIQLMLSEFQPLNQNSDDSSQSEHQTSQQVSINADTTSLSEDKEVPVFFETTANHITSHPGSLFTRIFFTPLHAHWFHSAVS
ncbi:hypothetical protein OS493_016288 [Desmophyllum pertusum]|nr:hypothetical protein OS493_016288 [Desmophyllum pertusum]